MAATAKKALEDSLQCHDLLACACHRNNGLMVPLFGIYNLTLEGSRRSSQRCFLSGIFRSLSGVLAALASIVQSQWHFIYNPLCFFLEKKNLNNWKVQKQWHVTINNKEKLTLGHIRDWFVLAILFMLVDICSNRTTCLWHFDSVRWGLADFFQVFHQCIFYEKKNNVWQKKS